MNPWPLDGLCFRITGLNEDGRYVDLVQGTNPTITFSNHGVRVETGCNRLSGPYEIDAQRRLLTQLMRTLIGCDKARTRQEERIAQVVSNDPAIELIDGVLILRGDRLTIEAVREQNP